MLTLGHFGWILDQLLLLFNALLTLGPVFGRPLSSTLRHFENSWFSPRITSLCWLWSFHVFLCCFQHMSVRNVIKTTKTNSRSRLLTFRPLGSHFSLFLSHFHRFRTPFPLPNGLQSRPFALPDAPRAPPEPHWVPTLDPTGLQHVHQGPFSHHGTSFWTETVRFRTNFRSFSVPVRPPDIRIHTDTSQPNHLDTSISEGRRGTRSAYN